MQGGKNKTVVIVCGAPVLAAEEAVFSFWGFPYPHPKSHWQCFGNMKKDLIYFPKPIQTIKSKWDSRKASENNSWSVKLSESLFFLSSCLPFFPPFKSDRMNIKCHRKQEDRSLLSRGAAALMSRRLRRDALFLSD